MRDTLDTLDKRAASQRVFSLQAAVSWATDTLISPRRHATAIRARDDAPTSDRTPAQSRARVVEASMVEKFVQQRDSITRFVRDAIADAIDRQKTAADRHGRKNFAGFVVGDKVLLTTNGIQAVSVTNLGASKLAPRYIRPFTVLKTHGKAYTLDIPTTMMHPTFYVGRLKRYSPAQVPESLEPSPRSLQSLPPAESQVASVRPPRPSPRPSPHQSVRFVAFTAAIPVDALVVPTVVACIATDAAISSGVSRAGAANGATSLTVAAFTDWFGPIEPTGCVVAGSNRGPRCRGRGWFTGANTPRRSAALSRRRASFDCRYCAISCAS